MSKIALTPNASGTGTLTIAAPNTNTDRTLTLPDEAGTVLINGTNQNVGIGTTSPQGKLNVQSSVGTSPASFDAGQIFTITNDSQSPADNREVTFGTSPSGGGYLRTIRDMSFVTVGDERMRITSNGSVGIGTSSPANKLVAADTNCIVRSQGTGGYGAFYATGSGTNPSYMFFGNAGGEKGRITSEDGGALVFSNTTGASERMRIDSAGRIFAPNQARCVVTQGGGWRTLTAGLDYGVSDGGFPVNNGGFFNGGQINGFNVVHMPVSGWYRFDMYVYSGNGIPAGARLLLMKNNAEEITFVQVPSTTDSTTFISRMFYMSANDYVNYRVAPPGFPNFTAFHANNHTMLAISLEG